VNLLVDTHAFLWFVAGDSHLSATARAAIEDSDNQWYLSAASVWEMSIKSSLGRLSLPAAVEDYIQEKVQRGLRVLSIDWLHAARTERLAFHHRDPFDRLIAAQALADGLAVVTRDTAFRDYGVTVVW
jgi:PIN domain nuclease of toxin-antitoxin system